MDETLNRIVQLIGPKHGAGKQLADYLEINPNVITNWKNGSNKSYRKYLQQISEYFNVSVEYLLGNEELPPKKQAPVFTMKDERDISKKLQETLNELENEQGGLMFDGEPLDDATRELLLYSLRSSMELGKRIAKEKYTPKKYRK